MVILVRRSLLLVAALGLGVSAVSAACATPPIECSFTVDDPHMGRSPAGSGKVIGKGTLKCATPQNIATDVHLDRRMPNGSWVLVGSQVQGWTADSATYLVGVAATPGPCIPATYRAWGRAFTPSSGWSGWMVNEKYVAC